MRPEIKETLGHLVYAITGVQHDLALDPAPDAQFSSRLLGTLIGQLNLRLGEQYGMTIQPVKPVDPEPEPEPAPVVKPKAKAAKRGAK